MLLLHIPFSTGTLESWLETDRLFPAGSHPKVLVGNLVQSSEMGAAPSLHPVRLETDPAGIHVLCHQRLELFFFPPLYAFFPALFPVCVYDTI